LLYFRDGVFGGIQLVEARVAEQGRKGVADFALVAARQWQALQPVFHVQGFHFTQQVLAPIRSNPNLQHRLQARNGGERFAVSLASFSGRFLADDPFGKFLCARIAITLLESLVGYFFLDQKLRKFAPLALLLNGIVRRE
jgi:hypothetical protein